MFSKLVPLPWAGWGLKCKILSLSLKARLVAGGHKQILGVDCHDTASPTARGDTIKIAYALAASKGICHPPC